MRITSLENRLIVLLLISIRHFNQFTIFKLTELSFFTHWPYKAFKLYIYMGIIEHPSLLLSCQLWEDGIRVCLSLWGTQ